jgi:hypothetical protein
VQRLLGAEELWGVAFLVLGNKCDADGAVSEAHLRDALGLSFRASPLVFFQRALFESFLFRPNAPDRGVHVLRCETVGIYTRYERDPYVSLGATRNPFFWAGFNWLSAFL